MALTHANPRLLSVMLFQHHQTTTPFAPVPPVATMANPRSPVKEKESEPEQEEDDEQEKEKEEDDGSQKH